MSVILHKHNVGVDVGTGPYKYIVDFMQFFLNATVP